MTRFLPEPYFDALQAGTLMPRDFIWMVARELDTGAPVEQGVWSDLGLIDAPVIDPLTGDTVTRSFYGAGASIVVSDIKLVQGVTVQTLTIQLLHVTGQVVDFFRSYDCKQADIYIFRGLLDLASRNMVVPAVPRFAGFIDDAPIETPKEGEIGKITVTATSNTQELTRANSDTRSDASQRLRSATDNFYQDVAVVKDWQMPWGTQAGPVPTSPQQTIFTGSSYFGASR